MPGRFANVELQLLPGALTDDTDLAAKLRAIDMDKVRFRGNRAETIKAWLAFNVSGMSSGTARGIHTYTDLDGDPIVVAASESAVNAWKAGPAMRSRRCGAMCGWVRGAWRVFRQHQGYLDRLQSRDRYRG